MEIKKEKGARDKAILPIMHPHAFLYWLER